jgi:hypothetical protein
LIQRQELKQAAQRYYQTVDQKPKWRQAAAQRMKLADRTHQRVSVRKEWPSFRTRESRKEPTRIRLRLDRSLLCRMREQLKPRIHQLTSRQRVWLSAQSQACSKPLLLSRIQASAEVHRNLQRPAPQIECLPERRREWWLPLLQTRCCRSQSSVGRIHWLPGLLHQPLSPDNTTEYSYSASHLYCSAGSPLDAVPRSSCSRTPASQLLR